MKLNIQLGKTYQDATNKKRRWTVKGISPWGRGHRITAQGNDRSRTSITEAATAFRERCGI